MANIVKSNPHLNEKRRKSLEERITKLEMRVAGLEMDEIAEKDDTGEWVTITEKECPTLSKYGAKPFKIMKRKMRDENENVWNNINFYDAKKECEKLGYRLPDMQETLALLEHYTSTQKEFSEHDKEFLGIEELSCDEDVRFEWIEGGNNAFLRGGYWTYGAYAGTFALTLDSAPADTNYAVGFRMCSDL